MGRNPVPLMPSNSNVGRLWQLKTLEDWSYINFKRCGYTLKLFLGVKILSAYLTFGCLSGNM